MSESQTFGWIRHLNDKDLSCMNLYDNTKAVEAESSVEHVRLYILYGTPQFLLLPCSDECATYWNTFDRWQGEDN